MSDAQRDELIKRNEALAAYYRKDSQRLLALAEEHERVARLLKGVNVGGDEAPEKKEGAQQGLKISVNYRPRSRRRGKRRT
jgi:hypothetical protein